MSGFYDVKNLPNFNFNTIYPKIAPNQGLNDLRINNDKIHLGFNASIVPQQTGAISIGLSAGSFNQGEYSIALGAYAGTNDQSSNSIILNATGEPLESTSTGALFIKPIRELGSESTNYYNLNYNKISGEVVYKYASPPGIVQIFAGSFEPAGYLFCDGRSLNISDYPNLYDVIGTTYGVGNDAPNTFNLPNLNARIPVGLDHSNSPTAYASSLGQIGGESEHVLTIPEMPTHNHTINDPGHSHSLPLQSQGFADIGPDDDVTQGSGYSSGSSTTGITINNTGNSVGHNNLQPYLVMNYIISY